MSPSEMYDFEVEMIERELVEVILNTVDVLPDTTTRLENLDDVNLNNLLDQQYLKYDASSGKWINVTLEDIIQESSVYNESPTKLTAKKFQTANSFVSSTLRVFLNGIKEKNITVESSNEFSLPIDSNVDDEVEVNYVKE